MKINIGQLRKDIGGTQSFSFKTSAEDLGVDNQQGLWSDIITVEIQVTNKGNIYQITGTVNTAINQCCSRCLEPMVHVLNIPFSEDYKETELEEIDNFSSREINYFTGDEIDITDLIRENILLAEPLKPVCSENCRGLCPECGTNLNIDTCGCNPIKTDPRLAVLEKLLSKD
ncbi:hypothetical protein SCACP_15540 [Sporomusa carbonis]